MSSFRWSALLFLAGILPLATWVCGAAAPDSLRAEGLIHPEGWRTAALHGARYAAAPEECRSCHGTDLKGGSSRVDCAGCHSRVVHQPRNDFSMNHPRKVKLAPGAMSGFAACQVCHGRDFGGTPLSAGKGCMETAECHFHPKGMPHDSWNGRSLDFIQHTHTDTDPANAPVCFPCHDRVTKHRWFDARGKSVTYGNLLKSPAPAGTAPGCFNSTLCHDRELPSPRPKL